MQKEASQVDVGAAWDALLATLKELVGAKRFQLWFKQTKCINWQNGHLVIGVPNLFVKEWLEEKLSGEISEAARRAAGADTRIEIKIDGELFKEARRKGNEQAAGVIERAAGRRKPVLRVHTLESFIVGPCNRVAYGASVAVADNPGGSYNPLFLHGSVGLGKTHLLRGLSRTARKKYANLKIAYLSGESFTNQFIMSLQTRSMDSFRDRMRRLDMLMIDDVHFLAGKNAAQEEFLNTFNCLSGLGKQIVMASDAHPSQLKKIRKSLTTRFMSGLVAELTPPGLSTRLKILEEKLKAQGTRLSPDLLRLIARKVSASVRDLEGACNLLKAYRALIGRKLDRSAVEEAIGAVAEFNGFMGLEGILREVAARFDVAEKDIVSSSRRRDVVEARHMFMYLARELSGASFGAIGDFAGSRSHPTVMSACRKVKARLARDEMFAAAERAIRASLGRAR